MFDLTATQITEVKRILAEFVPECTVRVFGSRAVGTHRHYSDLDLALCGKTPLEFSRMNRLREALQNSTLPFRVDFIDEHSASETFKNLALKNSCPL